MASDSPCRHEDLARIARAVMLERGFRPDFPEAVERQLAGMDPSPALDGAADLRELPWISIDNEDSRDLDQLTAAERLSGGRYRLLVAVADVASRVARGTPIDEHAGHNTTSVYTVPRVFPMLPLRLCTDLTSLNEDRERLALVSEAVVDGRGGVESGRLSRARVTNHAQLAYPAVGAWLVGAGEPPRRVSAGSALEEQLRVQDELAQVLKERRFEEGALEFESRTPRARYADGRVVGLEVRPKDRAGELIENFMIAANGVMARFLAAHGPLVQRVVRRPRNWERLRAVAAEHGAVLPPEPDGPALARFLAQRRRLDPGAFADLSLVVVKLLGAGEYAVVRRGEKPLGHFGLAVRDYAHSTAPNRRFPDLVTQRLARAILTGAPAPYTLEELEGVARRSTEKENDADKVERHVRKSAAASFLCERVGERFRAVVTGASEKGTFVRLKELPVEGMLVRGGRDLEVGTRLRVELVAVDVERGYIDFAAL